MATNLAFGIALVHALLLSIAGVVNCKFHHFLLPPKFFVVTNYGAVADGHTDNSQVSVTQYYIYIYIYFDLWN